MSPATHSPKSIVGLQKTVRKSLNCYFEQSSSPFHPDPIGRRRSPVLGVSVGASKLLGLSREKIIGRTLDDFAAPDLKPVISETWRSFLEDGQQEGTLHLMGADGTPREVDIQPNATCCRFATYWC